MLKVYLKTTPGNKVHTYTVSDADIDFVVVLKQEVELAFQPGCSEMD